MGISVFGLDMAEFSDNAISEAIKRLQAEQERRRKVKDAEIVKRFREVAQELFDNNIIVSVACPELEEHIYLDNIKSFTFEF